MTDPNLGPNPGSNPDSDGAPPSDTSRRNRIIAIAGAAVLVVTGCTVAIAAGTSNTQNGSQPGAAATSSAPADTGASSSSDSPTSPSASPGDDDATSPAPDATPGKTPKPSSKPTSKPSSTSTAKPTSKPTPKPTSTPRPSPTPTSTPTFDPDFGDDVSETVSVDDEAALDTGVTAEVTAITDTTIEGDGVGQISGPAVRVKITIRNSTPKSLDLDSITVNAYTGKNNDPASPVNSDDASDPFAGSLAAGAAKKGVYVFGVADDASDSVTVTVDLGTGSPLVVFTR